MLTEATGNTRGMFINPRTIRSERFNVQFSFEIGGGSGADGLALVLLEDLPSETEYTEGGNLGLEGIDGIAVEFDTWKNSWDPEGHHVGVNLLKGDISPLAAEVLDVGLRNNGVFDAEVHFQDGRVQVYLSNAGLGMRRTLVLEHGVPDFAAARWYLGFTAATGAANDRHVIHRIRLQAQAS